MQHNPLVPRPLATERSPWLRGTLLVPGDEMISQVSLLCAGVARGRSTITGALGGRSSTATAYALRGLGAQVTYDGEVWQVTGLGASGLLEPVEPLDFRGAPLGLWLTMGLAGSYDFQSAYHTGHEYPPRLTRELLGLLQAYGIASELDDGGRKPIRLVGPRLAMPLDRFPLPSNAPAMSAAMLLAALAAPGVSSFVDHSPGPAHVERVLVNFGVPLAAEPHGNGRLIEITGVPDMAAQEITVPANPSLAAIGVVAASLVAGSELRMPGVLIDPARAASLAALMAMGAGITISNRRRSGGEDVADIVVEHEATRPIALAATHTAMVIPELPFLAVLAGFARGPSTFHLPHSLDLIERLRIADVARGLQASGVPAEATEETLVVHGRGGVRGGGRVVTNGDAALAMAFLVLGMAADEPVTIDDPSGIEGRFPGFVEQFEGLGASFIRTGE